LVGWAGRSPVGDNARLVQALAFAAGSAVGLLAGDSVARRRDRCRGASEADSPAGCYESVACRRGERPAARRTVSWSV